MRKTGWSGAPPRSRQSIGFGAERLGLLAVRHPRSALALSLVLFAVAFSGLLQLRYVDDASRVFSGDNPISDAYDRLLAETGDVSDALFVIVEGDFAEP